MTPLPQGFSLLIVKSRGVMHDLTHHKAKQCSRA